MSSWERTFEMHWTYQQATWLRPNPNPPYARFRLKSETAPSASCGTSSFTRYRVIVTDPDDVMCCFWDGVWLVQRGGSDPLPDVHDLPRWNGTTAPPAWDTVLGAIHNALIGGGVDYLRLEGFMPVIAAEGIPRVDQVQMVLLPQALAPDNNGIRQDLMLVSLQYADQTGGAEDGAAGGPPK